MTTRLTAPGLGFTCAEKSYLIASVWPVAVLAILWDGPV